MNRLVLFSSSFSKQASAVPSATRGTRGVGQGTGKTAFDNILTNAIRSTQHQNTLSNDNANFLTARQASGPVPLSFLFSNETAGVKNEDSLQLPASALSEDTSGRLLISLRQLSAILKRLNQANTEENDGNPVSLEKILPANGSLADGTSLSGESAEQSETTSLSPGLESSAKIGTLQYQDPTGSPCGSNQEGRTIPVVGPQQDAVLIQATTHSTPQESLFAIENSQSETDTQTSNAAELVVDEKGELYIAFSLFSTSDNSKAIPEQVSDIESESTGQNPADEDAKAVGVTKVEAKPNPLGVAVENASTSDATTKTELNLPAFVSGNSSENDAKTDAKPGLLAITPEQSTKDDSHKSENATSEKFSSSPTGITFEQPDAFMDGNQHGAELVAETIPFKIGKSELKDSQQAAAALGQIELGIQAKAGKSELKGSQQAAAALGQIELGIQAKAGKSELKGSQQAATALGQIELGIQTKAGKSELKGSQQAADFFSQPKESGEKLRIDTKNILNGGETIHSKSLGEKKGQDSSSNDTNHQGQKTIRLFIRKENLPKNLQQLDRNLVLTVRSDQTAPQPAQVSLSLDKDPISLSLSVENGEAAQAESPSDTVEKPMIRAAEASLQPGNVTVHKAELDSQLLNSFTSGFQRRTEAEYTPAQRRPADPLDPETTQPAPDSASAAKLQGSTAPIASQSTTASHASSGRADASQVIEQVVRGVSGSIGQGRSHITIRLNPPHLGNVNVQLIVDNGVLTARLTAEQASTRSILDQHSSALRQSLVEHGVKVNQVTVLHEPAGRQQAQPDRNQQAPDRHNRDREGFNGGRYREGSFHGNERRQQNRQKPEWDFDNYFA